MTDPDDREAVLDAFAVEAVHDRGVLERYLRAYPDLAGDLIDLSSEIRFGKSLGPAPADAIADPGGDSAWLDILACGPGRHKAAAADDPFAGLRGAAFRQLASALKVPGSVLTALRDGLVETASVPTGFIRRFAEASGTAANSLRTHLDRPRQVPEGLAFKSDTKPAHQGRTTFRRLVLDTPMPQEQRLVLLRECDEDGLP